MIDATDPIDASGDSLDLLQTCWATEANDASLTGGTNESDTSFSDGTARRFDAVDETQAVEFNFTTGYTIPSADFGLQIRLRSDPSTDTHHAFDVTVELEGATSPTLVVDGYTTLGGTSLSWVNPVDNQPPDIPPGTHTLRVERSAINQAPVDLDVIAPYDTRFSYTFDNTVHQNDGYLDGPELFPDVVAAELGTVETRRDVTEADATITTDTTDANQYVELRIGGGSFDRTNNSATVSTTGGPARSIDVNLGLTRYPDDSNPQSATPRYGYNGQSIDDYELTANPDAINPASLGVAEVDAVVPPGSIVGDQITEAAELDTNGDALTRAIFAQFSVLQNMEIRSSEKIEFNNPE